MKNDGKVKIPDGERRAECLEPNDWLDVVVEPHSLSFLEIKKRKYDKYKENWDASDGWNDGLIAVESEYECEHCGKSGKIAREYSVPQFSVHFKTQLKQEGRIFIPQSHQKMECLEEGDWLKITVEIAEASQLVVKERMRRRALDLIKAEAPSQRRLNDQHNEAAAQS